MGFFDWLKSTAPALSRQAPEVVFGACLRENRATTRWEDGGIDGLLTFGVIRSIEFVEDMAQAKLLVPRNGSMVEVPCNEFVVPIKTPTGWRVAADRGINKTGPGKLVRGTIALQAGDAVMVSVRKANPMLDNAEFPPRTSDGWIASMIGKYLPAMGYRCGDIYYFKGPWDYYFKGLRDVRGCALLSGR
jgi:hypothetical protein